MTHLVGGISSAGRAMPDLDGVPLRIVRSQGPHLWDDRGRRYIDYLCGMGADFLGHAPPSVVAAVTEAVARGPMPGLAHPLEEEAAPALAAHTGALDQVVFLNSGSEAVHLACRVARAVTGRGRIAKFAAGFDGWLDDVAFGNTGSEAATMRGNTRPATPRTTLLRYNDPDDVDRLFAEHEDIAAILVEPVLANAGCIAERPGYLAHLQAVARRHGALVIADEVLMGFRLHAGLTSVALGLDPDLATLGKAIGSGLPVAALVGRPDLMAGFTDGRIARAGTYSGNPPACAAVVATMAELARLDYPALLARGNRLRAGIAAALQHAGQPASTSGYGSVFSLWFAPEPPEDYATAVARADAPRSLALHLALRRHGVMTLRSAFGRMFLSAAHTDADMEETIAAFSRVAGGHFHAVARRRNHPCRAGRRQAKCAVLRYAAIDTCPGEATVGLARLAERSGRPLIAVLVGGLLLAGCGAGGRHATRWDGRRGYDGNGDYGYDVAASQAEARGYRLRASRTYVAPGPAHDPWGPHIREASARFGVPEPWIREVMRQESGGRPYDAEGLPITSRAGAMGLMQVMPRTFDILQARYGLGSDPYEPRDNILAGTAYLREMHDRFGAPGFLAAYNAGPDRVEAVLTGAMILPEETVSYVASIAPRLGLPHTIDGPAGYDPGARAARVARPSAILASDQAYAGGGMTGEAYASARQPGAEDPDPSARAFEGGGLVTPEAPTGTQGLAPGGGGGWRAPSRLGWRGR